MYADDMAGRGTQGGNHFEGFVEEVEKYYFEDEDGNGCGGCALCVGCVGVVTGET